MIDLSIDLTDGQVVPALLYTVTRVDGTVERVTNATRDVTTASPLTPTTWSAMGGLRAGVLTQRNDGTPPVFGLQITLTNAGKFRFRYVDRGLYERAHVLVQLTDTNDPTTLDFIFEGLMLGEISYNIAGQAAFELISKFAIPRDIFVKIFTLGCDHMFGDPLTCTIPVFPYELGRDLQDVERNEVIVLDTVSGATPVARRRFRFGSDDTPEDYLDVYLETSGQARHLVRSLRSHPRLAQQLWTAA